MFGNAWRVGRIAGIEIRIDISWAVIALLVSYTLYLRFAAVYGGLSTPGAIALGAGAALLFFSSVLIHELAHSLVAKAKGIPVRSITLFLFGGATHAKVESRGPGAEFQIAVVGPLTSVALAGVFGALAAFAGFPEAIGGGLGWLAFINLVLAGFNLVPGFPLDGGRILRAAVWKATGDMAKATRVASAGGQLVGYGLVALGLFFVFGGGLGAGIWFAAIGWFLAQAARMSYEQMQVRRMLEDADAEDVMAGQPRAIPADLSLRDAVDDYFMRHDHGAFPVEDQGSTVGLLTLRRVKQVAREEWEETSVRQAMGKLDDLVTVSPDTSMADVMTKLEGDHRRVLVVEGGEVVGIVTPSDVARWLQRRQAIEA